MQPTIPSLRRTAETAGNKGQKQSLGAGLPSDSERAARRPLRLLRLLSPLNKLYLHSYEMAARRLVRDEINLRDAAEITVASAKDLQPCRSNESPITLTNLCGERTATHTAVTAMLGKLTDAGERPAASS